MNQTNTHAIEKMEKLSRIKEKELNVAVLETVPDEAGNMHLLARRNRDGTYVVWSSYNTGEDATSYVGLYGGKYDLSLTEGVAELKRRAGHDNF